MQVEQKKKTIPIFVSHMGCPNDCAFCNQRTITGQCETVTPELAKKIIEDSLKTLPKHSSVEIGFFGGSFTGIEHSLQEKLLAVAHSYIQSGKVHAIRLSTRPDYISTEIVDMLKCYVVTTVELGAQSMRDDVLKLNLRGHTNEDTIRASEMIKDASISLGLQMMTGLLGDTYESAVETAREMIVLSPSCVRIYPTLVLKGTHLHTWYQQGLYAPQTLDEAVYLCAELKEMFDVSAIPVIRMGLMASDNIHPDKDVVAGPYHPSFGELVQSELYFRAIKKEINGDAKLAVHPKSISAFIGNKRKNIERFRKMGVSLQIVQSEKVSPGTFQIIG